MQSSADSSVPQQNSAQTPVAKEQPKRILYIIPNYRAVSADAVVAPLDARGKFNLMVDDSFDYSTFISVGLLAGIAQAQRSVPQFDDGPLAYSQYYWHIFVDQAVGNAFTEYLLPVAFKQDPRYFTKGTADSSIAPGTPSAAWSSHAPIAADRRSTFRRSSATALPRGSRACITQPTIAPGRRRDSAGASSSHWMRPST